MEMDVTVPMCFVHGKGTSGQDVFSVLTGCLYL